MRIRNEKIKWLLNWPPIGFVVYVITSFWRHDNSKTAFYLAFTSLFAVVPMMTVVYSILALIPELKGMEDKMQSFVFEHFVPETGTQLEEHLENFSRQAASLTSVGVVMLFVTSVLMLRKIETSFNTIWHVVESRKGINGFLLYWALLSLGPVMMGGAFAVSSYVASLKVIYDMVPLEGTQKFVLSMLPVLLSGFTFSLAYIAIPNTRVRIRDGLIGGMVAALMFDLAKRGMGLFITLFPTYHLVYGAFAALPIFLMWILVSWFILLLGAEIVQAMTNFKVEKNHSSSSSLGDLLGILETLYRHQSKGNLVQEVNMLQTMPWISSAEWENYLTTLKKIPLVCANGEGELVLSRDLHKYTLAQLFRDCFGDAIKMDLQDSGEPWRQKAQHLYDQGVGQCFDNWTINLAELFDESLQQRSLDLDPEQGHPDEYAKSQHDVSAD